MKLSRFAYILGVLGTVIILVWVGFFKFTPTESLAIKPLVEHHFAMSWMYSVMTVQMVSNVIGYFEIATGIALFLSLFRRRIGVVAGLAGCLIFITTLSFLVSTPNSLKIVDNVYIVDFFLLKDIPYLAICIMVFHNGIRPNEY